MSHGFISLVKTDAEWSMHGLCLAYGGKRRGEEVVIKRLAHSRLRRLGRTRLPLESTGKGSSVESHKNLLDFHVRTGEEHKDYCNCQRKSATSMDKAATLSETETMSLD